VSEEPAQETQELTPQDASERAAGDAQLVDVRSDHEWEAGHIAGATHIVFDELSARASEIDRGRPVILYCRGGNRSSAGAAALRSAGYDATNVAGGIAAWAEEGLPLEPEGGYVAESGEAAAILESRRREGAGSN
jgi:rhodanese-related sulfurtransferase